MKIQILKPLVCLLLVTIAYNLSAQLVKETVQPLSKKAHKGYMDDVKFEDNGNIDVLYKISGDKNKDELFFEQYSFDKDLKFIETKSANEPKIESKPDRERTYMLAYVGGGTSFDILSMKLKVYTRKAKEVWDYKKQRYVFSKKISDETVKLKNEDGRAYYGVDQYRSEDTGDFVILAYYETKDKKNPKQYVLLTITFDGEVTEKQLDVSGAYMMVYCGQISEEAPGKDVGKQDFIVVLAPKEGNGDASKYVYLHYDLKGTLKNKVEFQSPSPNLLINNVDVKNGEVYFCGLSRKGNVPYWDMFKDYAAIDNPFWSGGDANKQQAAWSYASRDEMDNFHLLKFSGNKMVFATTAAINEFKSKAKTAPGEKSGKIYNGKKFWIQNFEVTPANEFLISGQLSFWVNIGSLKDADYRRGYGDVVCFHFDSKGALKAQYAIDKVFEDKKSEIFEMPQKFFVSADGKYAYWEILEVKGFTGYNSWSDAYNGSKTFRARFFPRLTKIDLQSATLSEFKTPGQKKYFVYKEGRFFNPNTLTATYVGRDEDLENLWISKVTFE